MNAATPKEEPIDAFEYGPGSEDPDAVKFADLYRDLGNTYTARWNQLREAERARAQAEGRKPNSVPAPVEYDLIVPPEPAERQRLVDHLRLLFQTGFRGMQFKTEGPVFREGEKPESGRPFPFTVYEADLNVFVAVLDALPPPEREDFLPALRRRVNAEARLFQGGLIEALAVLIRHFFEFKDTDATVKRAKAMVQKVPGVKGIMVDVKTLPPPGWAGTMGGRVMKIDDEVKEPTVVKENQRLFAALSGIDLLQDHTDALQAVIGAFNTNVDKFANMQAAMRRPAFLRVQWFNALLKNLFKAFNVEDLEQQDVEPALSKIAQDLQAAVDFKAFQKVINGIGRKKAEETVPPLTS